MVVAIESYPAGNRGPGSRSVSPSPYGSPSSRSRERSQPFGPFPKGKIMHLMLDLILRKFSFKVR